MNRRMIIFFLAGLSVPFIALFAFVMLGGLPTSTEESPLPFERTFANFVIHLAMQQKPESGTPLEVNEQNLQSGIKVYLTNCSVCHGVPNTPESPIALGMFPKPPQLFLADQGVTDDPESEIYWKIKNGIRLTGMPGFQKTLTTQELWQVTQLVHEADKLPASALKALQN